MFKKNEHTLKPPCKIVAEIGSNHNGSWEFALQMLDQISAADANAAKFQYYRADKLYPENARVAEYLVGKCGIEKNTRVVDLLKKAEVPEEWLEELVKQCKKRSIGLIMSVFDEESVDVLIRNNIKELKIGSPELTHFRLLRAVGETGYPVIVSTGNAKLGKVEKALEEIDHDNVILLHCTAAYPVPEIEANLRAIRTLYRAFGMPVGLSDHTESSLAAAIAVALGAVMVEKHFTLDKNLPGPDHEFSTTKRELAELVQTVRSAERLLGNSRKVVTNKERELEGYNPGLFAACDISKGERISDSHIDVRRRNREGIGADYIDIVRGRTARTFIQKGSPISWEKI